ncbi:MAG: hypothetical protein K2L25_01715 [Alphaproteobacteria bacterium]|nr:hypothetical protein [Alphaproteobacteria bacterium]
MKKYILVGGIIILSTHIDAAYALGTKKCTNITCPNGYSAELSDCANVCNNCPNTKTYSEQSGYVAVTEQLLVTTCPESSLGFLDCGCETLHYNVCPKGYYGKVDIYASTIPTCTRCPASGGIYGTTDAPGAQDITECYMPADTEIKDETGTFSCSEKSYYKK